MQKDNRKVIEETQNPEIHSAISPSTGYILVLIIALVICWWYDSGLTEGFNDGASYQKMAEASPGISSAPAQPFRVRILCPYIVGLLPLPVNTGFWIMTRALTIALLLLMYYYLTKNGIVPDAATLTVFLFACSVPLLGCLIRNHYQAKDIATMFFAILTLLLLPRQKWLVYGIVLSLWALNSDLSALIIPVTFVYLWQQKLLAKNWRPFVASVIPVIAIYFILRRFLPYTFHPECDSGPPWSVIIEHLTNEVSIPRRFINISQAYAPICFIPIIYYRTTYEYFKKNLHILALMLMAFTLCFIFEGTGRHTGISFISIYFPVAIILQTKLRASRWIWIMLIVAGAICSVRYMGTAVTWPSHSWRIITAAAATLITGLGVLAYKITHKD